MEKVRECMNETLCWSCKNTDKNKCCWFDGFKPVPGWTAEKVVRHYTTTHYKRVKWKKFEAYKLEHDVESYNVIDCPNFELERAYLAKNKYSDKGNFRENAKKVNHKPKNPFKAGTKIYKLYEGDWRDKGTDEVAEVLGMSREGVRNAIYKVRERTGYNVPIKWDEAQARRARKKR